MVLLSLILGTPDDAARNHESDTEREYAVLLNARSEQVATANNAFVWALGCDESGCELAADGYELVTIG